MSLAYLPAMTPAYVLTSQADPSVYPHLLVCMSNQFQFHQFKQGTMRTALDLKGGQKNLFLVLLFSQLPTPISRKQFV